LIENLIGTTGNDNITGNNVANVLRGNGGYDDFYFRSVAQSTTAAPDIIQDFGSLDRLVFSDIDARPATAQDDAFTFLGTGAFTGNAGEIRYTQVGNDVHVFADVNGDGVADMQVILLGKSGLSINDFTL
jgi:hypothetical protein